MMRRSLRCSDIQSIGPTTCQSWANGVFNRARSVEIRSRKLAVTTRHQKWLHHTTRPLLLDRLKIFQQKSDQKNSVKFLGTSSSPPEGVDEATVKLLSKLRRNVRKLYQEFEASESPNLTDLSKTHDVPILTVSKFAKALTRSPNARTQDSGTRLLLAAVDAGCRHAAFYLVSSALRLPGGPFSIPALQPALDRVRQLAANDKTDVGALTLTAQLLDGQPQHHDKNADAEAAFALALQRVESRSSWSSASKSAEDEVVSVPDLMFAYGTFLLHGGVAERRDEAVELLKKAALLGGHLEACLALVPLVPRHGPDWHGVLVKLAASGHGEAACELADLYSLPDEQWESVDAAVKREVVDETSSKKVRVDPPSRLTAEAKSKLAKYYRQANEVAASKLRFHRALDWLQFASSVGNVSAMLRAAKLAFQLRLPYETVEMAQEILLASEDVRKRNMLQVNEMRQLFFEDWRRGAGEDSEMLDLGLDVYNDTTNGTKSKG